MISIKLITWLFLVAVSGAASQNTSDVPCQNGINNSTGICIPIYNCHLAMTLLNDKENRDSIEKLRLLFCGFENKLPQVCCSPHDRFYSKLRSGNSTTTHLPNINTTTVTSSSPLVNSTSTAINITAAKSNLQSILPDRSVCGLYTVGHTSRVHGGDVAELDEFPWLVRIKYTDDKKRETYACAGSLITDRYVISAAHCFTRTMFKVSSVRLGEWNTETGRDCYENVCNDEPVDVKVASVVAHPASDTGDFVKTDIALLRLAQRVNFTDYIRPVCLPTTEYVAAQDYVEGSVYSTAGWGITELQQESTVKRKIFLKAVSTNICEVTYPEIEKTSFPFVICAGGMKGVDSCRGDSGGSLVKTVMENNKINYFLFGITSTGKSECGAEGYPGLYTRVTTYMKWILENIQT